MTGYHRNIAVLDACVLYPAPLRDLLLSLAAGGMFAARWTEQIQEEWIQNLLAKRPELDPARLRRTANLMCEAVEDCLIANFEHLIDSLTLPDPGDRQVMAAAIAGNADVIVTFNQKDFPKKSMRHHGIKIFHPDDFIVAQFNRDPVKAYTSSKHCERGSQSQRSRHSAWFRHIRGNICPKPQACCGTQLTSFDINFEDTRQRVVSPHRQATLRLGRKNRLVWLRLSRAYRWVKH